MSEVERRIAELERKLARVTDELELLNLTASYGPAVDSASGDSAAHLWTEDGVYDVPGVGRWTGRDQLRGMLQENLHQSLLNTGCAHVLSRPRITITGDTAVATCYSRLYQKSDRGFDVLRVSANRWEFVRGAEGWRIKYRLVHALDGSAQARNALARSFQDADAGRAQ